MALSLSRSDTNTTPFDWLARPLLDMIEWITIINKVQAEADAEEKKKARKK